jgi:[lysine-biosynthesis-protein LysW]--L-2-aminoadipate ligase
MPAKIGIVAHRRGSTNDALASAWCGLGADACVLAPEDALRELSTGDVALARLDVLETLDGIEPGLDELEALGRAGVRLLNPPHALTAAHDKLETVARLGAARLPHPRTVHVVRPTDDVPLPPPFVVKPRHGSWGRDVSRCAGAGELLRALEAVSTRAWFRRHGALVQELVPSRGWDLRLVVAGGQVVGAAERVAAPGEWRTNVSLGGSLRQAHPDEQARALATAAAAAIGADLVGVDLCPTGSGYVVLELNGAVDFDERYSLDGRDAYAEAAGALGITTAPPARYGDSRMPGAAVWEMVREPERRLR